MRERGEERIGIERMIREDRERRERRRVGVKSER